MAPKTILKYAVVAALILLSYSTAVAGTCGASHCTGANPWTADSHDYADVDYCVDNCITYDDTLNVPAGDGAVTWASVLTLTKGFHLSGPGASNLTVTLSTGADGGINIDADATSVSTEEPFEISGFTFDGNGSGSNRAIQTEQYCPLGWGLTVKIHDNTIQNYQSYDGQRVIRFYGMVRGVVYSNTFTAVRVGRYLGGSSCASSEDIWNLVDYFTYGTENNVYFEDNTITGLEDSAFAGGHASRIAVRFNTITIGSRNLYPMFDAHGNQPSGVCAVIGAEWYKNTVTNANGKTAEIDMRGGRQMNWANELTSGSWDMDVRNEYCNDQSGTCGRDGDTQTFNIQNSYHFLNLDDGAVYKTYEAGSGNDCGAEITEDSEYFIENTTFTPGVDTSLSSGVAIGTAAQMGIVTTCSEGVGFWVTDEGEWNSESAGNDGRLYTCNDSNTFTLYYTPYTYPHPLRTETVQQKMGGTKISKLIDRNP